MVRWHHCLSGHNFEQRESEVVKEREDSERQRLSGR